MNVSSPQYSRNAVHVNLVWEKSNPVFFLYLQ